MSTGLSLVVAGIAAVLSLLIWRQVAELEAEARSLEERAATCAARPTPVEVEAPEERPPAPPEDRVQRDRPYLGDEGIDVSAAMRVSLQEIEGDGGIRSVRAGDPSLLAPDTIHVVNLWAVWCSACKDEMPDFKALFAARAGDWGERVRFAAIQVNDHSTPKDAYASWASMLPKGLLRLADRGQDAPLLKALRGGGEQQPLFFDELPVTLVLDCNRRVRWAKFERLGEGELRDLEQHIDRLRGELDTPRCRRQWCGNGRCEAGETGANRCVEDCGEPRPVSPGPVEAGTTGAEEIAAAPEVLEPPPQCPAHCARCTADGRCIPKLRGPAATSEGPEEPPSATSVPTPVTDRCGDGRCVAADGESRDTCCLDCGCQGSFDCRKGGDEKWACVPRLKP
jgi:thiol-disulfide isomerase/thioredoxin